MPEKIKKVVGETSWSTIFMGLAMALVVVMQQYQTMRIAEIKTLAEVNRINFMDKEAVETLAHSLEDRIVALEHKVDIKVNDEDKQ